MSHDPDEDPDTTWMAFAVLVLFMVIAVLLVLAATEMLNCFSNNPTMPY